jgi:hypothetical protein
VARRHEVIDHPRVQELRSEARQIIREDLLMGQEEAQVGNLTLTVDSELEGWERLVRSGMNPETLNGALQNLRPILEGPLKVKPLGIGLLRTKPQLLEQATARWLNAS